MTDYCKEFLLVNDLEDDGAISYMNGKNGTEFDWYVTDDDDLIILWSNTNCTRYIWNPNYESYKLSSNEYSWYIKGDRLFLSSNASESGYYVYTK